MPEAITTSVETFEYMIEHELCEFTYDPWAASPSGYADYKHDDRIMGLENGQYNYKDDEIFVVHQLPGGGYGMGEHPPTTWIVRIIKE